MRYNNWIPQCGIGNLLNVVLGEPQHLATVRALRLKEIRLDAAEISSFGGPRYGRNVLTQGHDLVVAPIKPSAGLSPEEASALAFEAAMGGVDIVKDDELAFPGLRGAPEERYRQVASAVRRAEQETGTRRAYWANVITSPAKALKAAEMAVNAGADALLLAPALQGLDVCADVSASIGLPVVAHNVGVTSMTRVDGFGIDLSVWMYLQRLAGADAVLAPSPFGSFGISPQSARDAIRATNDEVPGVSATLFSHSGGVGPENVRRLKSLAPEIAVAFTAGSAIFDHPFGPRSGAEALVLAVRALGSQGPSA
ncbi:RuBisCO large subunit C-terminal-like domain-containing protein [Terrabacter sp. Root181]|uniref:RuBisCO large subunit C-terminal-like domain-containing protein n=1 Tax=Terrabacter sp. Root181 TaxID=1736484 RepID=UPI00138EE2B7|nr:RuBisCO large subunit C-terminal-like domain-containing protein [Terrabacter sp. Root181]